ncbi:probable G-protein coupled receptor 85 isoform X3 [Bos indicus]|uniref:Probable G-protein coupled receptor 85 isoform X3 n=1 Tax=Bos indicus TaxID=9915 RepID=A0ABM4S803_BOSIN|nr:probable G-protein coupled receptor 85 isoform X2 [Bos indicus x Bos taurus]XP_059741418.1 probable G-protein coupled receptor 85 isoform X4 [Bos taurus]XP_061270069.1 probable G-protein coupled receptor 85 isoform X4 [Bos javanicus]
MQGGKSSEAATGDKSPFLPVQQDRTFNKPSPLWKRVGAPVGSTEAEVAPAAALATAAAAAAAPALLGETVPLRQGRTRLELKEAPSRRRRRALPGCSVKALRQKKNQQFIERRSYSLSGYPTPTDILMANQVKEKRKHDCRSDPFSLWITFSVKWS